MGDDLGGLLINLGSTVALLVVTYLIGSYLERRHFAEIRFREAASRTFPVLTFKRAPATLEVTSGELVSGSVVISLDYFKRFLAGLRGVVGGPVSSFETLLDRGRREAVLRMVEEARRRGYNGVICVRLETARLASGKRNGKGTAGIEVLAFGTAIKLGAAHGVPASAEESITAAS